MCTSACNAALLATPPPSGAPESAHDAERDALSERLLRSTLGAFDVYAVYLGDRLNYYRLLAEHGPLTSSELAVRSGTHERYVREWLEQQAQSGILRAEDLDAGPSGRRFALPPGHAEVLTDAESLNYLAPLARLFVGVVKPLDLLLDAFRTGGGVPFEAYGEDMREGQGHMNRAPFLHQLGAEWLPSIPDLHARLLRTDPPARIADVGCGTGWSSIGMARAYPRVRVDGFDLDDASVVSARENVRAEGLEDRVNIHLRDAGDPTLAGRYDLVTAFECVHDMSDPVVVLRTMRSLAGPGGTVLVMDERVAETFTPSGDEVERIMYGFSVFHCLPVGLVDSPSVGTGTVMRPDTLRRYAEAAGYSRFEILPIDNYFYRFYRLTP